MNCYDFDKTIYNGDSTVDFFKFCLSHYPGTLLSVPATVFAAIPFGLGLLEKTKFKQIFYRFLRHVPGGAVEEFWKVHENKLKAWYLEQREDNDLIISASPEFLLSPICNKLGIRLLASRVDGKTGQYTGLNCHGEEKVRRFEELNTGEEIQSFYSDSYSDQPLARLAKRAYMVKGDSISPWEFK